MICFNFSFSQLIQDSISLEYPWKMNGKGIFLVNQSSFSNWTSGGQSSVSGTIKANYNLNY